MEKDHRNKMSIGIFGGRFTPLHNGHVGAILRAAEQVDKLFVVLSYADNDPIQGSIRLRWMKAVFSLYPNIAVLDIKRDKILETVLEWKHDANNIRYTIFKSPLIKPHKFTENNFDAINIDKVFVGSNDHDDMFKICYPEAEIVVLDPLRSDITISGTEIRNNIYSHWEYLPKFVRKDYAKIVVVFDDRLRNQLTDRFSTVKVEDVFAKYVSIYGNEVVKQPEIDAVISAKALVLSDEAAYNANRVYFVPQYWRASGPHHLIIKNNVSLDDAIEQVKKVIK